MGILWGDLRKSLRSHVRHPAVAIMASLSLGLGVATATTMFSLMNALFLRSLPIHDADRVVRITRDASSVAIFSGPEVERLQQAVQGVVRLVPHQVNEATYRFGDAPPATAWFEIVGPAFFEEFGAGALLGRVPSVGQPTSDREVMLSYSLWRRLGEDPAVVGAPFYLNGESFVVVGVAPEGFRGTLPGFRVEMWTPMAAHPILLPRSGSITSETDHFLFLTGRLAEDATLGDLQARLSSLRLEQIDGGGRGDVPPQAVLAEGMLPAIQGVLRPLFVFLSAMVGLVLLIACANVAGLLLARGAERIPELSTRVALGASRWRLVRALTLDGLVVAVVGGGVAVVLTWAGVRLAQAAPIPAGVPVRLDPQLDVRVLAFALLVTITATLVASLVPAGIVAVRAGSRGAVLARSSRVIRALRRAFVGGQISLATLLVGISLLLGRAATRVTATDPGFRVEQVVTLRASADLLGYEREGVVRLWTQVIEEARSIPVVTQAGAVLFAPLGGRSDRMLVDAPGTSWAARSILYNEITPGALEVLALPVLRGRGFVASDVAPEGVVAVLVNETFAAEVFPDREAVGRTLLLEGGDDAAATVVGVVRDAKYRRLSEAPTPHLYTPLGYMTRGDMMLIAHVAGPAAGVLRALRERVTDLDPDLVITTGTLRQAVAESTFFSRVAGVVVGVAGGAGLLLALAGLFGTVSYEATRQVRETAIRRALGASDAVVRRSVVWGSLRSSTWGALTGLVGAVTLGSVLRGLMHGLPPYDPPALAALIAALLVSGLAATWAPSRQALRVAPAELLKGD